MINFSFIKNFYLKESEKLDWLKKPKIAVLKGEDNHYTWFPDGQLNLYENCITKYLKKKSSKTAIITIDKNKDIKKYNYNDIDKRVNNVANYIIQSSSKKNLKIMIHASASIESAVLMLACAKLGLHFSVIFEELEALGIKNRLKIFKPNIFFTRVYKKNFSRKIDFKLPIKTKFIFGKDIKKVLDEKKK